MSERVERALARLQQEGTLLAPELKGDGFGVFVNGDRRRRPMMRLAASDVRALESAGAIVGSGAQNCFVLSRSGASRVTRTEAAPEEAYLAQHRPIVTRSVMDESGAARGVRAFASGDIVRKLAAMRDVSGAPWFSADELAVASRLRADWERGQMGLTRGSDLTAPPRGGAARGAGNAAEHLMGAACDARRCVAEALASLAAPLRRVVEAVCLAEQGLEAVERAQSWPPRSGKVALRLALAQLAARRQSL
ncbi:MAG: hypothetical protein HY054_09655 [Proteobacteria bacterium]|nr:hypothetical protein [Pseudomonadota bacterium]